MQAAVQAREGTVGVRRRRRAAGRRKKVRTAEFSNPEEDVKTVEVTKEGK